MLNPFFALPRQYFEFLMVKMAIQDGRHTYFHEDHYKNEINEKNHFEMEIRGYLATYYNNIFIITCTINSKWPPL